jgi:hypothetical protein
MKMKTIAVLVNAALLAMASPVMAAQGPSTTTAPYVQPMIPGVNFTSILTTGDIIGGYKMGGVPDGLGAFDNGDGTITVLMNHEIPTALLGIARAHGSKGAYVSSWVIDKTTLQVLSGADLMKNVLQQVNGAWLPVTVAFARFCSADLADASAFFHDGKGTHNRIFLNGEESGAPNMRGVAHVATGPDKGNSYLLPWASATAANAAWENLLANPHSGDRTVVMGNADGGTNGLYVYVGTKSRTGNDIERAGLVNGTVYRVAVNGTNAAETRAADAGLGLVANPTSGRLEAGFILVPGADITNAASTKFLRPEDGAWDKKNKNRFYFVTTDQPDAAKDGNANSDITAGQIGRSRVWALNFTDSAQPELGGKIELLLDGTLNNGEYQMLDNITVNDDGTLIMQEDVGNNKHNGKMWKFNPATGDLVKISRFDQALFGDIGIAQTLTKDEETSGVIDVTRLLGRNDGRVYNLFVVQNHAPSGDAETVEGGQLVLMSMPATKQKDDDDNEGGRRD